jgi:ketosteroid isomerase-like protein
MKRLLSALLTMSMVQLFGQNPQIEINAQVWKPFTKAIMQQDAAAFAALHSMDLIRVERNNNKIFGLAEYRSAMEAGWPGWKESIKKNQIKYTFELRFAERLSNGEFAYEVGYFKNESVYPNGENRTSFGKFHVALRKENGTWKILVDSDSNEGGTITAEMFQTAKPLE